MAALPYMAFYPADYLADTTHLSTLEHGAYCLLIFNQWQTGKPLSKEDGRLAKIVKLSVDEWQAIKNTIIELFQDTPEGYVHKRVMRERERVGEKSEKAKASANSRWKKRKPRHAVAMLTEQNRTDHTLVSKDTREGRAPVAKEKNNLSKATRLPTNWKPDEQDANYARSKGLSQRELDREAEKFLNFWTAKAGQGGLKLDWAATWRNWILRVAQDFPAERQVLAATTVQAVMVAENGPEHRAWLEHYRRKPSLGDPPRPQNGKVRFYQQWPPGHEERQAKLI